MNPITELHQKVDAVNAALAKASADKGKPITCKGKGCSACCYEPVYCSSDEARYLVEGLTEEQKAEVARKTEVNLLGVGASGLFKKDMPPVMEWLAMKLPCPLLEHGACIAYERRPTGCRTHMAIGPPEWCGNEHRLEQRYPKAKEVSMAIGQAILDSHMKLGNIIHNDNMLALLANELLGEYTETASAEQIVFIEEKSNDHT